MGDLAFGPGTLATALAERLPGWPAGRIAVALSGGPDSAALLAAAAALAADHPALNVRALHVDHGLQAAAPVFVGAARAQAAAAGVECVVLKVSVDARDPAGPEAAARRARYAALGAALAPGEALLTAHHREDQAETLLLQLLRGAGPRGLSAMPPVAALGAGLHLRPCLETARAALVRYAALAGPPAVTDPMNGDRRFDRVYLRATVAPLVGARWPGWARTVARAAGHLAAAQRVLDEVAAADLATVERDGALGIDGLARLSVERRDLVIRHWLRLRGVRPPSVARLAALHEVRGARAGRSPLVVLGEAVAFRHAGALHLGAPLPAWPGPVELGLGGTLEVGAGGRITLGAAGGRAGEVRLAARHVRLTLRPRAGGERLTGGRGARRAVKDVLRESGVPAHLRAALPFVWSGEEFLGVLTPRGLLTGDGGAAPDEATGPALCWHDAPAVLNAAFIETPVPLP